MGEGLLRLGSVLGAVIGVYAAAAAIAQRLRSKFGSAHGLFGRFIRRVQSGGFAVQAAMLLFSNSVSRLAYLQRCLPPAALEQVACEWDGMLEQNGTHANGRKKDKPPTMS